MSKQLTTTDIFTRLAAERKFSACVDWMHAQGKRVSLATLRRALREDGRTPRQQLAIQLAKDYLNHITAANGPKETITQGFARLGMTEQV